MHNVHVSECSVEGGVLNKVNLTYLLTVERSPPLDTAGFFAGWPIGSR